MTLSKHSYMSTADHSYEQKKPKGNSQFIKWNGHIKDL